MSSSATIKRPERLCDIASSSATLTEFGMNLRDWQHEIRRGGCHSKAAFQRTIEPPPELLADRFPDGEIADAYLAAYAEWLADRAGLPRPTWTKEPARVSSQPWFGTPLRGRLLAITPASFRQRNIFTVPEPVFIPRRGRPSVPAEQKAEKARQRQKAYRKRLKHAASGDRGEPGP